MSAENKKQTQATIKPTNVFSVRHVTFLVVSVSVILKFAQFGMRYNWLPVEESKTFS